MDYLGNITNNKSISIKEITDTHCKQYTTMPTASIDLLDKIVQYIGTTTSDYTNGYFYKCIEDTGTYKWNNVEVQEGGTDSSGIYLPLDGSEIMTGSIQFDVDEISSNILIKTNNTNKTVYILSGTSTKTGASLALSGKDVSALPGGFQLIAHNGTTSKKLIGRSDGTLTWNSKNIFLADGSVNLTGIITSEISDVFKRNCDDNALRIFGGSDAASIALEGYLGETVSGIPGSFGLLTNTGKYIRGGTDRILSWNDQFNIFPSQSDISKDELLEMIDVLSLNIFPWVNFSDGMRLALFAIKSSNRHGRLIGIKYRDRESNEILSSTYSNGVWSDWVAK